MSSHWNPSSYNLLLLPHHPAKFPPSHLCCWTTSYTGFGSWIPPQCESGWLTFPEDKQQITLQAFFCNKLFLGLWSVFWLRIVHKSLHLGNRLSHRPLVLRGNYLSLIIENISGNTRLILIVRKGDTPLSVSE